MIKVAFAKVMEARRGYFNARFAQAQVTRPDLEGDAFLDVLRAYVAPIVEAVASVQESAAPATCQHLYEIALDLFAQGLLVPHTHPRAANVTGRVVQTLDEVWRELLPALAPFLAEEPQRVAAAVLNAAYNLAQTPDARPQEWIVILYVLAPHCKDVDTLLRAGQVAAWRSGMAQYRLSALPVLKTLDAPVARLIFGLGMDAVEPNSEQLHHALMANPWYVPWGDERPRTNDERGTVDHGQQANTGGIEIVRRVGMFRGFGGTFIKPPQVVWTEAGFVASDGEGDYLITADAFGGTLHRTVDAKKARTNTPFRLGESGEVSVNGMTRTFPELANATSSAGNQTTLAVTTGLSHAVYFVATG